MLHAKNKNGRGKSNCRASHVEGQQSLQAAGCPDPWLQSSLTMARRIEIAQWRSS